MEDAAADEKEEECKSKEGGLLGGVTLSQAGIFSRALTREQVFWFQILCSYWLQSDSPCKNF